MHREVRLTLIVRPEHSQALYDECVRRGPYHRVGVMCGILVDYFDGRLGAVSSVPATTEPNHSGNIDDASADALLERAFGSTLSVPIGDA